MDGTSPAPKPVATINPFSYPAISVAAARIEHDPKLAKSEAHRRASDLRCFQRYAGLLPDAPFEPKSIGKVMMSTTAATAGVSVGRWRNIQASVRWALHHLGLSGLTLRSQCDLLESWKPLRDEIRHDLEFMPPLSRLMRYFSANAIGPGDVKSEHFVAFHAALRDSSVSHPNNLYRAACKSWNLVRTKYSGWPDVTVEVPSFKEVYTRPIETFPLLQPQLEAYLAFARGDDKPGRSKLLQRPLGKARRGKPSAGSIKNVRYLVRRAASCLVERGRDPASITLETLADPDILADGLQFLQDRRRARWSAAHPGEQMDEQDSLRDEQSHLTVCTIITIARRFLKVPQVVLDELGDIRLNVAPSNDAGARILKDLEPLLDETRLRTFYREPDRILAEAEALESPDVGAARRVMYALWWRFETRLPLRLNDSLTLRLGENVTWSGAVESAQFGLHMTRTAKGGKSMHVNISESVACILRPWLVKYRPLLGAAGSPYIFPNEDGDRRDRGAFSQAFKEFMLDRIGFSIRRHSFRHLAVYTYMQAFPGDFAGASSLLGHASIKTTINYYDVMRRLGVWERFDKLLLKIEDAQ